MNARIAGFVLRAKDKAATADFYRKLGLLPLEHEHGGPVHYEMKESSENFVTEIYQKTETFDADAVMIEVESLDEALAKVKEFGVTPKTEVKETTDMRFLYITDPDGRDVLLMENKIR